MPKLGPHTKPIVSEPLGIGLVYQISFKTFKVIPMDSLSGELLAWIIGDATLGSKIKTHLFHEALLTFLS